MTNSFTFIFVVLVLAAVSVEAFFRTSSIARHVTTQRSSLSMLDIKVDNKVVTTSEKTVNLRKTLQANKVDVYPLRAKITGNCGGAGICGTCAVQITEGDKNINPASKNEQNTLKGKPASFRLSCCARVSGNIACKTKVN